MIAKNDLAHSIDSLEGVVIGVWLHAVEILDHPESSGMGDPRSFRVGFNGVTIEAWRDQGVTFEQALDRCLQELADYMMETVISEWPEKLPMKPAFGHFEEIDNANYRHDRGLVRLVTRTVETPDWTSRNNGEGHAGIWELYAEPMHSHYVLSLATLSEYVNEHYEAQ